MTGRSNVWVTATIGIVAALGLVASGQTARERLKDPSRLNERAPDAFRARFDTSQGVFVISVERDWAPLAADRFYNLAKNGFYDDSRFFRVLDGFMAQFGLHADAAVQSSWTSANLRDEPVLRSNTRGFVSFTRESGPNSRYTMIFINYKDNSYLDADGFAPFGQVVSGMDVVDKLYSGYGRQNVPDQRRIVREGNAYLLEQYPRLDFIKAAIIESAAQGARSTWSGVYTRAQASRGQTQYEQRCEQCHGSGLGGDATEEIPALVWDQFFSQWSGRSIADLVARITRSMPPDAPGSTDSRTATDVASYILQANGFPDGSEELRNDDVVLRQTVIEKRAAGVN